VAVAIIEAEPREGGSELDLNNEIKALKWAAEIIRTSCESREGNELCAVCPFRKCCGEYPKNWDLDSIGRCAAGV